MGSFGQDAGSLVPRGSQHRRNKFDRTLIASLATLNADGSPQRKQPDRNAARLAIFHFDQGWSPQVEYLNSGIAFSSSLVALNTAWSGHQGFGFEAAGAVAVPVVVVFFMPPPEPAGALAAPV